MKRNGKVYAPRNITSPLARERMAAIRQHDPDLSPPVSVPVPSRRQQILARRAAAVSSMRFSS